MIPGLRTAVIWLALLVPAVLGAERIRVATLNLGNYLATDRMVEGTYRPTYPKPENEKAALRSILRSVDADVVAMQEMGAEAFLIELQRDLLREGLAYPHRAWMRGADSERHLAVLSRLPIAEMITHDAMTFSYFGEPMAVSRGLLELVFENPGGRWHLFNVHLKSRLTVRADDPKAEDQRTGEAVALRDRIRLRFDDDADARVVVVGDFNDSPVSRPLSRFLQINRRPFLAAVPCFDSRGETWTHYFAREDVYSRSDYFLVSPALLCGVREGRGWIHDDPDRAVASDHRLLWVELELSENCGNGHR